MKKLEFSVDIDATPQKVWDTMLNPESYREWVKVSWPNSYYEGEWKKGENLKFLSAGRGGTKARIVDLKPYEMILADHIAVINNDGTEDRESELAKGWIGTTEKYTFNEEDGHTKLKVEVNTNPEWERMFTDGWPNALVKLKELSEN